MIRTEHTGILTKNPIKKWIFASAPGTHVPRTCPFILLASLQLCCIEKNQEEEVNVDDDIEISRYADDEEEVSRWADE